MMRHLKNKLVGLAGIMVTLGVGCVISGCSQFVR